MSFGRVNRLKHSFGINNILLSDRFLYDVSYVESILLRQLLENYNFDDLPK